MNWVLISGICLSVSKVMSLGIPGAKREDENLATAATEEFGPFSFPTNPKALYVLKNCDSSNVVNLKEENEKEAVGRPDKNTKSCAEKETGETGRGTVSCSVCHGTGSLIQSAVQQLEGGQDASTVDRLECVFSILQGVLSLCRNSKFAWLTPLYTITITNRVVT